MAKKKWDADEAPDKKKRMVEMENKRKTTHNFYYVSYSKGRLNVEIDLLKMARKLKELGFFRYDLPNGSGSQTVYIKDNKISVVDKVKIIDMFEDYINSIGECDWDVVTGRDSDGGELWSTQTVYPDMIITKLYKNQEFYFGQILDRLRPDKPIKILTDDKYTKYLFFRNCVVQVKNIEHEKKEAATDLITGKRKSSDAAMVERYEPYSYTVLDYSEITDGYIWETSIVDHYFDYISKEAGDFEAFIKLICGASKNTLGAVFDRVFDIDIYNTCSENPHVKRVFSLMSLLGYLMHDFYDCSEIAVIFTDVNKDGLKAAGGTGKGLIGKSLDHLLNRNFRQDKKVLTIPGKDFDATKDTRYAAGDISTQLIHIEDLRSDFKLDGLYNDIADGATFRPLFHNPMYKKCKFMLSMNQALKIETEGSDGRRVQIFELANFFGVNRRPEDYFGEMHQCGRKRFWSETDWSEIDWCEFYSFMVRCAMVYINYGIIKPEDINFAERAAKSAVGSEDAWAFFENTFKCAINDSSVSAKWSKGDLWRTFNERYYGTYKTQKSFSEKLMIFLNHKHIRTAIYRDGVKDWIWLNPTEADLREHSMELKIK